LRARALLILEEEALEELEDKIKDLRVLRLITIAFYLPSKEEASI
jgi:hypothetical protein